MHTVSPDKDSCAIASVRPFIATHPRSFIGIAACKIHRACSRATPCTRSTPPCPTSPPYSPGNRWREFESQLLAYAAPSFPQIRASFNSNKVSSISEYVTRAVPSARTNEWAGSVREGTLAPSWSSSKSDRRSLPFAENRQEVLTVARQRL